MNNLYKYVLEFVCTDSIINVRGVSYELETRP
jgi:hypothetical protein